MDRYSLRIDSLDVETFEPVPTPLSEPLPVNPAIVNPEPASCIGRWCPATEVDCNPY